MSSILRLLRLLWLLHTSSEVSTSAATVGSLVRVSAHHILEQENPQSVWVGSPRDTHH